MRFLYYILFFVTPLAVYHKTSELFEFNKMILIYLIAASAAFLWIVTVRKSKTVIISLRIFMLAAGVFLLSQIISTITSIDVHTSLFGYYGRYNGGLASLVAYFLLFFVFIQTFESKDVFRFLKISLLSSAIVMLIGIPGKFGYDLLCLAFTNAIGNSCWVDQFRPAERMFSTLGQPNWLGAYLAIHFFIGLYFFFTQKKTLLWSLYLLFNFACVLLTRSDAAMIALVIGSAIFLLSYLLKFGTRQAVTTLLKIKFLLVGFLILTFIFGTGISKVDRIIDRIKNNTASQNKQITKKQTLQYDSRKVTDSFEIRKIVWRGAVEIGKSFPLFGTGVETFAYAYPMKRPIEHNLTSEWDFIYNKAHNEFLNYFATTGFMGLISYLGMIGSVIFLAVSAIRKEKDHDPALFGICLLSSYVTIHVTNFFGFSTTTVQLFFYLIPAFFMVIFYRDTLQKVHITYPPLIRFIILPIFALVFVYAIGFIILYYIADMRYALADRYIRTGKYQDASQLLNENLESFHYEHVYEDKLSYSLSNLAFLTSYQKEEDDVSKTLSSLSEFYNLKSIKASPYNTSYWKTRAKNQYLLYQISFQEKHLSDGMAALRQAGKISPTDPHIPYSLTLYYSLLEDDSKDQKEKEHYRRLAIESIEQSISLKKNYDDAYYLKAQLLKKFGDEGRAIETLHFLLNQVNPEYTEAIEELKR